MNNAQAQIHAILDTLPESRSEPYGERHLKLIVRKKTFANFMDNHHGDGRVAIWCKSTHAEQDILVQLASSRYFVPPYLGSSGWVALHVDSDNTDWTEVADLIEKAYRLAAPKKLIKELDLKID